MKSLTVFIFGILFFISFNASAEFVKLAECHGRTDANQTARAVIFVDKAADTTGFIAVNIQGTYDFGSATRVDWNSNPQGYPRFYDNDFDLDIVINDKTTSVDDILVGNSYVRVLQCAYDPAR